MSVKQKIDGLNGDEAVAYALKQCNVDLVAAYPITPQTIIVEKFSEYVANGEVDTEFVTVESEHSAMSACIGGAAAGGRIFTATASAGLALMHEVNYVAASHRLPIVMAVCNRALSGPINIHVDHSDSMGERDSSWIQLFSENPQEVYDNMIQAFRIGEDPSVQLPCMVLLDGFVVSHTLQDLALLPDEVVKEFVGRRRLPLINVMGKVVPYKLDVENPLTMGPLALFDYYFEHKRQQEEAMKNAKDVIVKMNDEFARLTGRKVGDGLIQTHRMEDAEIALICLGSTAGTTRTVVNELREKGVRAGLVKIRSFRPFPAPEIIDAVKGVKALGVLDRSGGYGAVGGPLFNEVRSILYEYDDRPCVVGYIYGLGGRDMHSTLIKEVYDDLEHVVKTGQVKQTFKFVGVR
ncbi:MAG: pyruvate ferredoxin oxidoreductase [Candidatus Bathyarchaeota archaeon]|nr:pyruvate ferredoxin oxidoreductase [Candidatus Bathyarchaeota archaeon]